MPFGFSGATHFLEVKKLPGLLDILIPGKLCFYGGLLFLGKLINQRIVYWIIQGY